MGIFFTDKPASPPAPDVVIRGKVSRCHVSVERHSIQDISQDIIRSDNLATVMVLLIEGQPGPVNFVIPGTAHALVEKGDEVSIILNAAGTLKSFINHTLSS